MVVVEVVIGWLVSGELEKVVVVEVVCGKGCRWSEKLKVQNFAAAWCCR